MINCIRQGGHALTASWRSSVDEPLGLDESVDGMADFKRYEYFHPVKHNAFSQNLVGHCFDGVGKSDCLIARDQDANKHIIDSDHTRAC